ncbi:MFS family permease [Arthrobacter pigmenti]|uniref:MFS family permease n=1 Tax=Arthrobacter pigmenti TaxID=271432 RepID=A0A846RHS1_9MICC|nr:MFS transporter [Arthrobacter pigmenti]NJC22798.1 MFS family permease [Arthrobacter pigmenti]
MPARDAPPRGGAMSAPLRSLTVGVIAIITCAAFEAMAVVTAMPSVASELNGVASYGLAFSMYLTASLLGSVLGGSWCDRRGPRPALAVGMGLMVLGLLISGSAPVFWLMTSGRAVSGLGGGFMIVAVYVIIAQAYPQRMQPVVFGWLAAAWVVPSLIGPYLAGILAEEASWRWVFLGVAPVVLAAFLLVWPRTARLKAPGPRRALDAAARRSAVTGVLLAGGVFAAQFGLTRVAASGFSDPVSGWLYVLLSIAGMVAAAASLPRLLPHGTLRLARGLPSVIATRGLLTVAFFGAEAFIPLMLVSARGLDASTAGLTLSAAAIGWSAGSFMQARVTFRRQWLLVIGSSLLSVSIGSLALTALDGVPFWALVVVWSAAGFAMGLTLSSTSVLVLKLSKPEEQGRNSAALQLSDQLGGVIGTAGAGALFALLRDPADPDQVPVFVAIWLALCVFAVVGIVAGLRAAQGDRAALPAGVAEPRKV